MKKILEALRQPAKGVAELRALLRDIPSDTAGTIAKLEARRRELLLDETSDLALAQLDADIAAKRLEGDRAAAAREEITRRLLDAEALEKIDLLAARVDSAEAEGAAVAAAYEHLPDLLGQLTDMISRARANHKESDSIDAAMIVLGADTRVRRTPRWDFGTLESYILNVAPNAGAQL